MSLACGKRENVLRSAMWSRQLRSGAPARARYSWCDRLVAHRVAHYPTTGRDLELTGGHPAHPARGAAGSWQTWPSAVISLPTLPHHVELGTREEPTPNNQSSLPVLSG